jgi:hypothetical protein
MSLKLRVPAAKKRRAAICGWVSLMTVSSRNSPRSTRTQFGKNDYRFSAPDFHVGKAELFQFLPDNDFTIFKLVQGDATFAGCQSIDERDLCRRKLLDQKRSASH